MQKFFNTVEKVLNFSMKAMVILTVVTTVVLSGISAYEIINDPRRNGVKIEHSTRITEAECYDLYADEVAYYKEKFGKEIKFVFNPDENLHMATEEDGYIYSETAEKEYIELFLDQFDDLLNAYTDEAIAFLPETIIITSGITLEEGGSVWGYVASWEKESLIICFASDMYTVAQSAKDVVNHEIFHVITNAWNEEEFDEFFDVEGSCSQISDYACTNDKEELSETWAYSFNNTDNLRANYLQEEYGYLLKA